MEDQNQNQTARSCGSDASPCSEVWHWHVVEHAPWGEWRTWAKFKRRENAEKEMAKICDRPVRIVEIKPMPDPIYRDMWAVFFPDGRIITGSDFENEEHAWKIALGWPHESEIEAAKRKGAFCTLARLRYYPPNAKCAGTDASDKTP